MNYFKLLTCIAIMLVIISCENEKTEKIPDGIKYAQTIMGGCNEQMFASQIKADMDQDTVLFSVQNDTLKMYVGISYVCCAPFVSDISITNDTIVAEITDTCNPEGESCYCHCSCYYTWDFLFYNIEEKKYNFRIVLDDPRTEGPAIIKEGLINIAGL